MNLTLITKGMITELRKIIALMIENNKAIAEQLLVSNQKYAQLLELLHGEEEAKNVNEEACCSCDECLDSSSASDNGNDTFEAYCEETMHHATDEDVEDCEPAIIPVDDELQRSLQPIVKKIGSLVQCVRELCAEDDILYQKVDDLKIGYEYFIETVNKDSLGESLIQQLGENGWVNIVIRLYAYSRIATFRYRFLNEMLKDLYEQTVRFYCDNRISIELPDLLVDEFDNTIYEYNNESGVLTDSYCEISPSDYVNKVYDIVQAGYTAYDSADGMESHKPVVFYYS